MRKAPPLLIIFFVSLFIFCLVPWISFTAQEKPSYTEECLDCHEDYDQTLAGTVHQLSEHESSFPVMCSDCHAGAEVHMEDPNDANIVNPAKSSVVNSASACRTCHYTSHQQSMEESNVHSENDVNCGACHKVHGNKRTSLLQAKQSELCYGCHQDVRGKFFYPYRHPVADGIMNCSDCHHTLDRLDEELAIGDASRMCFDCHNEFRGPFPYQHQAMVEYSTEGGSCLNCHDAHGSNLPRMLTQPYEAPNFALCSQCHLVPGHQMNAYHGDKWADRSCGSCHVDIHGSYINKYFLKSTLPDEEGENCFASECHGM